MSSRNSSLHQLSRVPQLYQQLMQNYIYHCLLEYKCKSCKFHASSNALYATTNYIDKRNRKENENVMILSLPQLRVPKSSINNALEKWNFMLMNGTTINSILEQSIFWIKYPKRHNQSAHERSILELFIGLVMNKMRKRIPNFVYTFGAIRCIKSGSLEDNFKQICDLKMGKTLHIVQEKVNGMSLHEWLQHSPDPFEFLRIVLQVSFALAKAEEKKGFVHNALYPSNIILRSSDIQEVAYHLGTSTYKIRPEGKIPTIIDYSSARIASAGFAVCYLDNPTLFYPGIDLCKFVSSSLAMVNSSIYEKVSWLNDYFGGFFNVASGSYNSLYEKYDGFNLPLESPLASLTARNFIQWVQMRQGNIFNKLVTIESRILKPLEKSEERCNIEDLSEFNMNDFSSETLPVNYNLPFTHQYDGAERIDYMKVLNILLPQYRKIKDYICAIRLKASNSKFTSDIKGLSSSLFEIKEILRHNISIIRNLPLYKLYHVTKIIESDYPEQKISGADELAIAEYELVSQSTIDIFPLTRIFIQSNLSESIREFRKLSRKFKSPTYFGPNTLLQTYELNKLQLIPKEILVEVDDIKSLLKLTKQKNINNWLDSFCKLDKQKIANITFDLIHSYSPKAAVGSFMDFGGGDGKLASIMSNDLKLSREHVWSADLENWMGMQLRHTYDISYIGLKESQSIPLPTRSIDLITTCQTLHHIKDVKYIINELRRVCKGFFVLLDRDCTSDSERMLLDFIHSAHYAFGIKDESPDIITNKIAKYLNDYIAWYRSFNEWKGLLISSGFKYISSQKIGTTGTFIALFSV